SPRSHADHHRSRDYRHGGRGRRTAGIGHRIREPSGTERRSLRRCSILAKKLAIEASLRDFSVTIVGPQPTAHSPQPTAHSPQPTDRCPGSGRAGSQGDRHLFFSVLQHAWRPAYLGRVLRIRVNPESWRVASKVDLLEYSSKIGGS